MAYGSFAARLQWIFRNFAIDMVPSSGPNQPSKRDLRELGGALDIAIAAASVGDLEAAMELLQPVVDNAASALSGLDDLSASTRNLFDKDTVTLGFSMFTDGQVVADGTGTTWAYSRPIKVSPGQAYVASGNYRFVTAYDAGGNVIAPGIGSPGIDYTPPAGVDHIVLTVPQSLLATYQFETGAQPTPFIRFGRQSVTDGLRDEAVTTSKLAAGAVTPGRTSFYARNKNLVITEFLTLGWSMAASGVLVEDTTGTTWAITEAIPVTAGQPYKASVNFRYVAYFDANGSVVLPGVTAVGQTFTPPSGAVSAVLTIPQSGIPTYQLEAGSTTTGYVKGGFVPAPYLVGLQDGQVTEPKIADMAVTPKKVAFYSRNKNLLITEFLTAGFSMTAAGVVVSDGTGTTWGYSERIPVTPSTAYKSNINFRYVTFFDALGAIVPPGVTAPAQTFTTPAGVVSIVLTVSLASKDTFQLEVGSVSTLFTKGGFQAAPYIIGNGAAASKWKDKAVAFLGDSITNMGYFITHVATGTGLVSSNYGVGGTRLAGASGSTAAMCQDARIDAIPTTIDALVICAGMNDFLLSTPMGTLGGTDPETFHGAWTTFAAKARARWPGKQIIVLGHTYGEKPEFAAAGWPSATINLVGLTTADYRDATLAACHRLNLPCVDLMQLCGWSSADLTAYAADLVHPDSSTGGRRMGLAALGFMRQLEPVV